MTYGMSERQSEKLSCYRPWWRSGPDFVNKSSPPPRLVLAWSDCLRPQRTAMGVDGIDQNSDVFGRRVLGDSVTEVKNMTGPASVRIPRPPEVIEHLGRLGADGFCRRKQRHRVQVALQ